MNNDNDFEYLIYNQTNGNGQSRIMICADDGRLHPWSGRGHQFDTPYEAWRGLRYRHLKARVVTHEIQDLR